MASDGTPDPHQRALWIIAASAAGLGLTAAAGSVLDGAGPSASLAQSAPRAVIGAAVGAIVAVVGLALVRRSNAAAVVPGDIAAVAITVAACVGALATIGLMPPERVDAPDADEVLDIFDVPHRTRSGTTAGGIVAPLDLDGDGRPDAVDGYAVLAYDADGDGVEDGRLTRCESRLTIDVEPDSIAINSTCSTDIDVVLPFDSSTVLLPAEVVAPRSLPERRVDRAAGTLSDLQGTIVLLVGLGLVLGALRFFSKQVELVPVDNESLFLEGREFVEITEPDPLAVVEALERSIATLQRSSRPRDAILAAYATLLDELRSVGLGRHPWEGPVEHCRRCLDEARLPDGPIDTLVELFSRARFGNRPMTEADRDLAETALTESVAILRAQVLSGPQPSDRAR